MAESETEISKEELQKEIAEILDNASLESTSTKKVIQKLEQKLGMDLTEKKKLIDQLVMDYVNSMDSDESMDEEEKKEVAHKKANKSGHDHEEDDDDDEQDDRNDSDYGSGKKKKPAEKKKKAAPKAKKGKKQSTKKAEGGVTKKRKGGYTKTCKLSPALAELMGESELPRHEVVKRVWAIIKEKQLYDPKNRQYAICDKALFKVIGEESFHTFSMMKYLKNHFLD